MNEIENQQKRRGKKNHETIHSENSQMRTRFISRDGLYKKWDHTILGDF